MILSVFERELILRTLTLGAVLEVRLELLSVERGYHVWFQGRVCLSGDSSLALEKMLVLVEEVSSPGGGSYCE